MKCFFAVDEINSTNVLRDKEIVMSTYLFKFAAQRTELFALKTTF